MNIFLAIFLIIYLLLNSLFFSLTTIDRIRTVNETIINWAVFQFFGVFIVIYNSIPRWHWFLDNVWFWVLLWFTDTYKDLSEWQLEFMRMNYDKKQTKAIIKKYGHKL